MAVNEDGPEITLKAGGTLATLQFHVVTLDTDGKIKQADDADDPVEPMLGILQNKPDAANEPAVVRIGGRSKAMGGATINEGVWVTCDSSGHIAAAVANDNVVGFTLTAVTADQLCEILVCPGAGYVAPA